MKWCDGCDKDFVMRENYGYDNNFVRFIVFVNLPEWVDALTYGVSICLGDRQVYVTALTGDNAFLFAFIA